MSESAVARTARSLSPWWLALGAGAIVVWEPFRLGCVAWPDMTVPAYFLTRGGTLYENVIAIYTPGVILLMAAVGWLAGFSANALRLVTAVPLVLVVAILAFALRGRRRLPLLAAAVPLVVLWDVYFEGPALWPDPFTAPILLGAGLVLDRWERRGRRGDLWAAALLLGSAILVKQTSAWALLAAAAWLAFFSSRRTIPRAALLVAVGCLPYAVFLLVWGLAHGTTHHIFWTLVVPLSGHAQEIGYRTPVSMLLEGVAPLLPIPAAWLTAFALGGPRRRRSPLPWLALGAVGMTWPRWGPLHLAGANGLLTLLALRSARAAFLVLRRGVRKSAAPVALVPLALCSACLLTHFGVAILGAGSLARRHLGAPVFYCEDPVLWRLTQDVRRRVGPGGTFLNYNGTHDSIYIYSETSPPGGLYVSTKYWFLLNKANLDHRLVLDLARDPRGLVLYGEPELRPGVRTELYRYLHGAAQVIARTPDGPLWLRVRKPGKAR